MSIQIDVHTQNSGGNIEVKYSDFESFTACKILIPCAGDDTPVEVCIFLDAGARPLQQVEKPAASVYAVPATDPSQFEIQHD